MVRFFPFTIFHNKGQTGSATIRVEQLIKYWEEAELYKYGEKPDVLIFQKVYWSPDYFFPETYKGGIKILDICDPDWLDNLYVKRTVDAMDAVVVPTTTMQKFIQQLTDKPVKLIRDRFDMEFVPKLREHKDKARRVVWFGYSHNAELLEGAVRAIEKLDLKLTIVSNEDPIGFKWADNREQFKKNYQFKKYDEPTIYEELSKHDICIMPSGNRPQDRFKSKNKTIKAYLASLPVAIDIDELEKYLDSNERNKVVKSNYERAVKEYDCKLSVKEYKELINEIYRRNKEN